jgi:hypothetical protein
LIGAACLAEESLRCLPCHEKQVRGYAATGMGRSAGPAAGLPDGQFRHAPSGIGYVVETGRSGMVHRLLTGSRRQEQRVSWFVGSGNEGRSFLIAIGDSLFQSPVSWYTRRSRYDLSPGYENDRAPGFSRPVSADCLFCHTGQVKPKPGTQNRYLHPAIPAAAITCERCHGDSSRHLAAPSRANVVNLSRLPAVERNSICEQCHLGGEARVPNPGRSFFDFKPGMKLEEVFSVYVRSANDTPRFLVVSHVEQLALSRCASASGEKLWCGSCHDPHAKPADAAAWYRSRCLTCHSGALPADHDAADLDCRSCHMPRRAAWDGGHTAFTDHRITPRPAAQASRAENEGLRAWRAPAAGFESRNLGLAYIGAGERNASAWQLNEGFRLLIEARPSLGADPAAATALGLVLLRKQRPAEAARYFVRALSAQPEESRSHLNLAVARRAAGETEAAIQAAEEAIRREPLLEEATHLLAEIYNSRGDKKSRDSVLRRYQQLWVWRLP